MYFLLSGEGVTDMGAGKVAVDICEGEDFVVGPMATIVAKIVEATHDYSILEGACGFISERRVAQRAEELKAVKKQLRLPGKKQAKETRYFFNTARILARFAQEKAVALKDEVVAVLFRDSDGTASAGRGDWDDKRESMLDGFSEEGFDRGVPMIPKPKSEAWLICAWKRHPYRNCEALEDRSGNDNSPNNLKEELQGLLDDELTPEVLREKVEESFDIEKIRMPSFMVFRDRLEEVIR
jgi:hypothetical protein